jgi:HEXXH motif-containing protein
MPDLISLIEAELVNLGACPWLPELTGALVDSRWEGLRREYDLTPSAYSTSRILARDAGAPRHILVSLPAYSHATSCKRSISVELLNNELMRQYEDAAFTFYNSEGVTKTGILRCLEDAISIINHVSSLAMSVTALIRSVHLIKPVDNNCDVSFSEPCLPFSAFISVPNRRMPNDALRVAEAIVHEAMHLQLTLVEQNVSLVATTKSKYFSPWKGERRPAQGVLHALYVFRVIDKFIELVASSPVYCAENQNYIYKRRQEIADQIREIQTFQECPELTPMGTVFVRQLIAS